MSTFKQKRALTIISKNPGLNALGFSRKMWPVKIPKNLDVDTSSMARRGMISGGSYLGKLRAKGLAYNVYDTGIFRWYITPKGIETLAGWSSGSSSGS